MTDTRWFGHPRGLSTLFFTEMWERFSYYGMRALLVLFMTNAVATGGMGLDDVTATAIYGLYTAAVYVVALPGGWIADHLLGLRRSVFWGGTVIAVGHFTLAIPNVIAFYTGLTLIVIGTGLLKPNISAIVGDLVSRRRRAARGGIFDLLHGHQRRRVSRTAGVRLPWRGGRLAPGIWRRRRRHGARAHPVLARRTASRRRRRVEARDGRTGAALGRHSRARADDRRRRRARTDCCRAAVDWRHPPVARRFRRLDRACSSSRSQGHIFCTSCCSAA